MKTSGTRNSEDVCAWSGVLEGGIEWEINKMIKIANFVTLYGNLKIRAHHLLQRVLLRVMKNSYPDA